MSGHDREEILLGGLEIMRRKEITTVNEGEHGHRGKNRKAGRIEG